LLIDIRLPQISECQRTATCELVATEQLQLPPYVYVTYEPITALLPTDSSSSRARSPCPNPGRPARPVAAAHRVSGLTLARGPAEQIQALYLPAAV
jgi:hypothetical protein